MDKVIACGDCGGKGWNLTPYFSQDREWQWDECAKCETCNGKGCIEVEG